MCLILFAFQQHRDYPLVVIANRDEYYARPTRAAHWWEDESGVFAGRDLEAGGSWLGVSGDGRFAAVTNVREPRSTKSGARSRGGLTREFLRGGIGARDYLEALRPEQDHYAGFNLLVGERDQLWFLSNRVEGIRRIEAGTYGISNGGFDEPWPKLSSGREALSQALQSGLDDHRLLDILTDDNPAQDHLLPDTGIGRDFERLLSSRFIHSAEYGTRASSIVKFSSDNRIEFFEQNYDTNGRLGKPVNERFQISGES